ncbi:hypothetical protein N9Z02_00145 [Akkermansiaceae bacterium]|nr:hypothetical protein [Akkermansiaceae bacterium]
MSIKGFHLIFICIAALFCIAFGLWALFIEQGESGKEVTFFGIFTLVAAMGLFAYAIRFYRKAKNIIV